MAFSSISITWNKWNTRGFVMLSLSLQVFLILFAPLRKKTTNRPIVFLLWLAYLMADWVAAFTIGLISHNQGNLFAHAAEVDEALQAFWASFLLLHLGGPDTITAFSMEDSSLWRRHLLSLVFQVSSAIYVFVQIFPSDKSLAIPTMLVFLAGVIKNVERTWALFLSSFPRLREWVLSPVLFEELNVPIYENFTEEEMLDESIVVKDAYYFFQIIKIFLGDLMFTGQQREMSRKYFGRVSAVNALRVISIELHFIYEVLHTKALTIRSKWSCIFRLIAFTNIVMAFVLFNRLKKHWLLELDMKITYALLFGGIALDVIALFMLVFSDWTVAEIKCYKARSSQQDSFLHKLRSLKEGSFLNKLVSATDNLRKPQFATYKSKLDGNVTYTVLDTPLIFRRWSESISACNLSSELLKERPRKMIVSNQGWGIIVFSNICSFLMNMVEKIIFGFHQVREKIVGACGPRNKIENITMIANTKYVSKSPFIKELWIFIFEEVKRKSKDANDSEQVMKIFEARGELFLEYKSEEIECGNLICDTKVNYDASVVIWHLATEIQYNKEKSTGRNNKREFSKILSDYMFYLLINQPNVVSAVAGNAQLIAGEILDLIREYIDDKGCRDVESLCCELYTDPIEIRKKLLPTPINFGPAAERKYRESVARERGVEIGLLVEAISLAREMESLGAMKWEVISGVWVEMLSYAAGHVKGEAHVQLLSKGGELLTFVWLLMAHFGCFYKPGWGIRYDRSYIYELPRRAY